MNSFELSGRVLQVFVMAIIIVFSSQSSFSDAVKHALACIGNNDLVLSRSKWKCWRQSTMHGSNCFIIMVPHWMWQKLLLSTAAIQATVELQNLQTLALFEAILPQCFHRPCNFAPFIFVYSS